MLGVGLWGECGRLLCVAVGGSVGWGACFRWVVEEPVLGGAGLTSFEAVSQTGPRRRHLSLLVGFHLGGLLLLGAGRLRYLPPVQDLSRGVWALVGGCSLGGPLFGLGGWCYLEAVE